MNVCQLQQTSLMIDLRPLLTCNETVVMLAAAKVVGNMISIAGATLGESFFVKEIGQAIQLLEGKLLWSRHD
jgi:hypothetical protein